MRTLALVFLFLLSLGLPAWASQPQLSAEDPIEFDGDSDQIWARGNATLRDEGLLLKADAIGFNRETMEIEAVGNVEFTRKEFRVVAQELRYNLKTHQVKAIKFHLGQRDVFVKADLLDSEEDAFVVNDTTVYYGAVDNFALNIKSKELKLYPDEDRMLMKDAVFRVGRIPLFYLPRYQQSFGESPFDLTSEYGSSTRVGSYVRNTFFLRKWRLKFAGTEGDIRVGGLLDYNKRRGIFGGPALRYNVRNDYTHKWGKLLIGGIRDHGDNGIYTSADGHIPQGRYFVWWRHKQTLGERTDITAKLDWWSDSQVQRDFRPSLFKKNQQPDNFAEATYCGDNYYLSAFGRFRPNPFQYGIQERLPELRFDALPTRLGKTKLYHDGHFSYTNFREATPEGSHDRKSHRFDTYYGLKRPKPVNDWLTFVPMAGARMIHFADASETPDGDNFTRAYYELGFDLEAHAYGQWDYQNAFWEVDGLRHQVRPLVQYRYIPQSRFGSGEPPVIDSDLLNPDLDPIDLETLRDIDDTQRTHLVRLGVENVLLTRKPNEYGARQLATLDFYQDIRISKKTNQHAFSDFFIKMGLNPVYWFNFSLYQRFDPERMNVREIYTSTKVRDGDIWELELKTYAKRGNQIHQYALGGKYQLNKRHLVKARWYFDARLRRMTKQVYSYQVMFNPAWTVEYRVHVNSHKKRPNDVRGSIQFNWLGA